jgi:hypothetical protein
MKYASFFVRNPSNDLLRAFAFYPIWAAISTFFRLGGLPPNQTPIGLGPQGATLAAGR